MAEKLNYEVLKKTGYDGYILEKAPVKVLQFGEGNFLRAFVDYWFDMSNEKAGWNGKVALLQPIEQGLSDMINEQEGLYTLYLRGSEKGEKVDRKRVISAIGGKAKRVNVILPFLYESRQHKKSQRESLDCAVALQELVAMGVDNIITFDAHDPRVMNSIPLHGFESIRPAYQFIKGICKKVKDLQIDPDHLMIISPDEGAMDRAVYMANVLGVDVGMFYKRRDYSKIVNGRNPIVAHEFLGDDIDGKDVIIIDDMIASGESMIDVARQLKQRKANRIFAVATFGLFTSGLESFDKAVEEGVIYKVVATNLTYQSPELLSRDYFISCDMSKYIALIIDTLNHDCSLSSLLEPSVRINRLLEKYKAGKY